MAWIKQVEEQEAQGAVGTLYNGYRRQMGMVPNILKGLSLAPEVMRLTMALFKTLMYGPAPLAASQREKIGRAHV